MENILIIISLVLVEGLLSIDNALVLAILVSSLPNKKLRKRALTWGILGAFIFRLLGLLVATKLIKLWYFQMLGALYLIFIAGKHFLSKDRTHINNKAEEKKYSSASFWKVVITVELTDIVFSIDSIVTAVAFSRKLWVVYTGGILGIITMRMVAGVFLGLIERFPGLRNTGYALVAWVGFKLFSETLREHFHFPFGMPPWLFWGVLAVIFFSSFFMKYDKDLKLRSKIEKIEHLEE